MASTLTRTKAEGGNRKIRSGYASDQDALASNALASFDHGKDEHRCEVADYFTGSDGEAVLGRGNLRGDFL